jgi:hypothetical protein
LFTVTLNFGAVFSGNPTWLAIGVRTNGGGDFIGLTPLQELTPTPYAIYAPSAGNAATALLAGTANTAGSVAAVNITGTIPATNLPSSVVTNNHPGVNLSGAFSGSVYDPRPTTVADMKSYSYATPNSLYTLLTNNGPGTIYGIRVSIGYAGSAAPVFAGGRISIFTDGVSNGCSIGSFFCAHCSPPVYHAGVFDLPADGFSIDPNQETANRLTHINAYTNFAVAVSFPAALTLYYDVWAYLGAPLDPQNGPLSHWHCNEVGGTLATNAVMTNLNFSGTGVLQTWVKLILSTNLYYNFVFLEQRDYFTLDGRTFPGGCGGEDEFGGAWYDNLATHAYAGPQWGSFPGAFLHILPPGIAYGFLGYRVLGQWNFAGSCLSTYTNIFASPLIITNYLEFTATR